MSKDKQRTLKQNASLHLWCELLADTLNESGLTIEKTLTGKAEIPWSKTTVKEILFKQIMKAMYQKDSTADLTTKELQLVSETLIKYLAETHGLVIDFPSVESMAMKQRLD